MPSLEQILLACVTVLVALSEYRGRRLARRDADAARQAAEAGGELAGKPPTSLAELSILMLQHLRSTHHDVSALVATMRHLVERVDGGASTSPVAAATTPTTPSLPARARERPDGAETPPGPLAAIPGLVRRPGEGVGGRRLRVLHVEDMPDDVAALREAFAGPPVLQLVDWTVVTDGQEALRALRSGTPFDFMLLDLNLPILNGLQVLESLKREPLPQRVPVVVLTTSTANADVERSYALGALAYVQKPYSAGEYRALAQALGELFAQSAFRA